MIRELVTNRILFSEDYGLTADGVTGAPFRITSVNTSNAEVIPAVDLPAGYSNGKWTYNGAEWGALDISDIVAEMLRNLGAKYQELHFKNVIDGAREIQFRNEVEQARLMMFYSRASQGHDVKIRLADNTAHTYTSASLLTLLDAFYDGLENLFFEYQSVKADLLAAADHAELLAVDLGSFA